MFAQMLDLSNCSGRSGRLEYFRKFVVSLALLFVSVETFLVAMHSLGLNEAREDLLPILRDRELDVVFSILFAIIGIIGIFYSIILYISAEIKRLHDLSLSGWIVLIHITSLLLPGSIGGLWSSAAHWLWIAALLLIPGKALVNRYGDRQQSRPWN